MSKSKIHCLFANQVSIYLHIKRKLYLHKEPYLTFKKEPGIVISSIFIVQTVPNPQLIGARETDQR